MATETQTAVATGGWIPHEPLTTPIPIDRLLTTPAKVLDSALWVSGRSQEDALAHSAFIGDGISTASTRITDLVQVSVDEPAKTVTMTLELTEETVPEVIAGYRDMYPSLQADWEDESRRLLALGAVSRSARAAGSQGCHIVPVDGAGPFFEPVEVTSALPPADTLDWPMGDILSSAPNSGPWGAVTDAAFADPDAHTAAFVVLHKGQVVCERYADGIDQDTQLESWSMGKSVTATMVGLLMQQGAISADLDAPPPIEAWKDDERSAIRMRDIFQMSSGLRFSGFDSPREEWCAATALP